LANLFENFPTQLAEEEFTELLARPGVRVERIVSTGQVTPAEAPSDQAHDEWVLLLRGSASLCIDREGERGFEAGRLSVDPCPSHSSRHQNGDQ
jgi:cupin 2 domain-containing protein